MPLVETAPQPGPSPTSPIAQSAPPPASPPRVDSTEKRRLIEELRKQTEAVLAQVRDATGNFREIDRLEAVQNLPAPVSASVTVLGTRARDFRTKVGYEVRTSQIARLGRKKKRSTPRISGDLSDIPKSNYCG
jgi:hypothetical protein